MSDTDYIRLMNKEITIPRHNPNIRDLNKRTRQAIQQQHQRDDTVCWNRNSFNKPYRADTVANTGAPNNSFALVKENPIPKAFPNDGYIKVLKHAAMKGGQYVTDQTALVNSLLANSDWKSAEEFLGRPLTSDEKSAQSISGYREKNNRIQPQDPAFYRQPELPPNAPPLDIDAYNAQGRGGKGLKPRNEMLRDEYEQGLRDYWNKVDSNGHYKYIPSETFFDKELIDEGGDDESEHKYGFLVPDVLYPDSEIYSATEDETKSLGRSASTKSYRSNNNQIERNIHDIQDPQALRNFISKNFRDPTINVSAGNGQTFSPFRLLKGNKNREPPLDQEQYINPDSKEFENARKRLPKVTKSEYKKLNQNMQDLVYPNRLILNKDLDSEASSSYGSSLGSQDHLSDFNGTNLNINSILGSKPPPLPSSRPSRKTKSTIPDAPPISQHWAQLNNIPNIHPDNRAYFLDNREHGVIPTAPPLINYNNKSLPTVNERKTNSRKSSIHSQQSVLEQIKNNNVKLKPTTPNSNRPTQRTILSSLGDSISKLVGRRSQIADDDDDDNDDWEEEEKHHNTRKVKNNYKEADNRTNYGNRKHSGNNPSQGYNKGSGFRKRKRSRSKKRVRFSGRGIDGDLETMLNEMDKKDNKEEITQSESEEEYSESDDVDIEELPSKVVTSNIVKKENKEKEVPFQGKVVSSLKKNKLGRYTVMRDNQPFGIFFIDNNQLEDNVLSLIRQTTKTKINDYPNQPISNSIKSALIDLMHDKYPDLTKLAPLDQFFIKHLIKRSKLNIKPPVSPPSPPIISEKTKMPSKKNKKRKVDNSSKKLMDQLTLNLGALKAGTRSKQLQERTRYLIRTLYEMRELTRERVLQISRVFKL